MSKTKTTWSFKQVLVNAGLKMSEKTITIFNPNTHFSRKPVVKSTKICLKKGNGNEIYKATVLHKHRFRCPEDCAFLYTHRSYYDDRPINYASSSTSAYVRYYANFVTNTYEARSTANTYFDSVSIIRLQPRIIIHFFLLFLF